ncbi:hypothetical protein KVR01_001646 [Diaporthe batatas]|uniref:uncharacterized protein n=1 Tax=Diaporthe batatas TaxID=748121 RepID=UPI001D03CA33|nr:uncharacterized protein KVR01_001646 [Diaporthe batatas]KAG8168897.1 hypothetical protein KVR01_001646 [Diaporthe batatas]
MADSSQLAQSFQSLSRLNGRRRCARLLESNDADEVLQGRNIYRACEPIVDFQDPFHQLTRIVGVDGESAGRVIKSRDDEAWVDPVLTECFCQVAGIYVNLMTSSDSLSERGQQWDVFAVHHPEGGDKYMSDVFAFDHRNGSLVEAILGISYKKVSLAGFRGVLSRVARHATQESAAPVFPTSEQSHQPAVLPTASVKKHIAKKAPRPAGPDFDGKTREIICNLSGLDSEEVQDESDLVEIGIDSLMAMELVREVESTCKVSLENEQLMDLTDFRKSGLVVTGAAGSLGRHIAGHIARLPEVHTVVCLNRLSQSSAEQRQGKAFEARGIHIEDEFFTKLQVIDTDTSKPRLGLSQETYNHLLDTVTHIVHSAWPMMSLARPVRMYESQFKVFRNLIDLARDIADRWPAPFRPGFLFVSSLAVVANYPLLERGGCDEQHQQHQQQLALVPEGAVGVEACAGAGYAEAKLVCERVLARTLGQYPRYFSPAAAVRVAQISGSTVSTLSWCPVDLVASAIGELLLMRQEDGAAVNEVGKNLFYHIDNPARQPWAETIASLASALGMSEDSIVPYQQWLNRVRRFRGSVSDNPAMQLEEFFIHYFVPMSCGGLVLDTTRTMVHSRTFREMGPVSSNFVAQYVASWRQSGFLHK